MFGEIFPDPGSKLHLLKSSLKPGLDFLCPFVDGGNFGFVLLFDF
jgi:hypothetical protein